MKRLSIGICVVVAAVLGLLAVIWLTHSATPEPSKQLAWQETPAVVPQPKQEEPKSPNERPKEPDSLTNWDAAIARGREIAKTAPPVGTPEWMNWRKSLSTDDRLAWAMALDEMRKPPEPTQAQKDAVCVGKWQTPTPLFPAKVLSNYRPLLRMDKSVSIRPLQVETTRTASGGLISIFWARRAKDSIVIDWENDNVTKGNVDSAKNVGGPSPEYVPQGMLMGGGGGEIVVKLSDKLHFKLPWTRNSDVCPLAMDVKSAFAFGSEKNHETGRIESVVVVDTVNKKLLGTIATPKANNGLHCIFEPSEYLMVFDYESQWVMLLDLKNPLASDASPKAP